MLESSLIKLDAQNCNFIKEDSNTEFLLWILWIIQKHLFCVEDLWTAGSETPLHLFKNTFFTKHHQWLLLTVSGFQPAALLKKVLQQGRFSDNFAKILKNIFLQKTSFQITYFTEDLWKTAYFMYKLQNFNHQIQ